MGRVTNSCDTISGFELAAIGRLQRADFIAFAVLLVCFAFGLRAKLQTGRASSLIPAFQFMAALGVIGDGIFICEPMHMVCDLIAVNSTLLVLSPFTWRFWGDPRWKGWSAYSIVTAVLMMGFLTAFGIANVHDGRASAFEKLAVATRTTWSVLFVRRMLLGESLGPRQGPSIRLKKSLPTDGGVSTPEPFDRAGKGRPRPTRRGLRSRPTHRRRGRCWPWRPQGSLSRVLRR